MLDPFTESSGTYFKSMEEEIWKPVVDAVGVYEVSNKGHLKCVIQGQGHRKRQLKPCINYANYENYRYKKNDGKYRYVGIQRIMMEAFVPVPDELKHLMGTRFLQVNHKDENPRNNTLENLEWCSAKYNTNYGTAMRRKVETRNQTGVRGAMVKVKQLSLTGEFIRVWNSMAEASNELGIFKSQICCCCKGTQKTAGGYKWEYVDDVGVFEHSEETKAKMKEIYSANPNRRGKHLTPEQLEKHYATHRGIPVAQYDLDGNFIKKWDDAPTAARFLHLDSTTIQKVCSGYRYSRTCGGFVWKYIK